MKRELRALAHTAVWHRVPPPREAHVSVPHPTAEAFVNHHGHRLRFVRWSSGKTTCEQVNQKERAR